MAPETGALALVRRGLAVIPKKLLRLSPRPRYGSAMTVTLTRAAEGLDRRAFTVAEVWKMIEAGVIDEDEQFELIEGEIVPKVSPESSKHIRIKSRLGRELNRTLNDDYLVAVECTLNLSDITFLEPDVHIAFDTLEPALLRGPDSLLVVEVSLSTLNRDLKTKARLYARHGVRELWVIDVAARETHIHRDPGDSGYGYITVVNAETALVPTLLPGVSVRLSELE
jgi:Uma2 family endonuclease